MKAIAASLGHYSPDFTESTYVSMDKIIYDADKEITAFAREILPVSKEIENRLKTFQ